MMQQNAIVTNTYVNDTSGKTINQYINADGNYNYYFGGNFFIKLKKLDANFDMGLNANGSKFKSFVNGVENVTLNNAPGVSFGLGKDKEKVQFYLRSSFNYNFSTTQVKEKQRQITTQSILILITRCSCQRSLN